MSALPLDSLAFGWYSRCPMPKPILLLLLLIGASAVNCCAQGAAASNASLLLVANQGDRTVSIIDAHAGKQTGVVQENVPDGWVHELVASPDGRTAFAPVYGNSGVGKPGSDGRNMLVIDIATRKIVGNIDFGHGVRPHYAVYDPNSGLLYVTTELDQTVTAVDPRALKIVGAIPTKQPESHMLAISQDGKRGYTANVGPGTVSVLDMVARKTIAVIPISAKTQRISISNDDRMVFTADQTKPQLAVIDTASNKVKSWVALPALGYGTAPTKDGRSLLVALPSGNKVGVVDLNTLKLARTIEVCSSPQEILLRPDGQVAYVSCMGSHQVAAIDLAQWKVQFIEAGDGADGLAWAGTQ